MANYLVNAFNPAQSPYKWNGVDYTFGTNAFIGILPAYQKAAADGTIIVFSGDSYGDSSYSEVVNGAGQTLNISDLDFHVDPQPETLTYSATAVSFNGNFTNNGTLSVEKKGTGEHSVTFTNSAIFTNSGTATVDSAVFKGKDVVNTGTFNLNGATFTGLNGTDLAKVANTGVFHVTHKGDGNQVIAEFDGNGTINLSGVLNDSTITRKMNGTAIVGNNDIVATTNVALKGSSTLEGKTLTLKNSFYINAGATATVSADTLNLETSSSYFLVYGTGTLNFKNVSGSGAIAVQSGATLTGSKVVGSVVFKAGSTLAGTNEITTYSATAATGYDYTTIANGAKLASNNMYVNTAVNVGSTSAITVKNSVAGTGSINVDTTDLGSNTLYKVVDGPTAGAIADTVKLVVNGKTYGVEGVTGFKDGDNITGSYYVTTLNRQGIYLINESQATLYVKSTYTKDGANDGHLYGYNAFSNIVDALGVAYGLKAGLDTTDPVSIEVDSSAAIANQELLFYGTDYAFANNILLKGKSTTSVTTVTIPFKDGDYGLFLTAANGKEITIDSTLTIKTTSASATPAETDSGSVYLNYNAKGGSVQVNGSIDAAGNIKIYGPTTVTGSLKTGGNGFILFNSGKTASNTAVTILGEGGDNRATQVKTGWFYLASGNVSATATKIEAAKLLYQQDIGLGDKNPTGDTSLSSNNTIWEIGDIESGAATGTGTLNFTNGSQLNVTGNADLSNKVELRLNSAKMTVEGTVTTAGTLGIANSEFTAAKVVNTGSNFYVSGGAGKNKITIGELDGELKFEAGSSVVFSDITDADDNDGSVRTTGAVSLYGLNTINATINNDVSLTVADAATLTGSTIINKNNGSTAEPVYASLTAGTGATLSGVTVQNGAITTGTTLTIAGTSMLDDVKISNAATTLTVNGALTVNTKSSTATVAGITVNDLKFVDVDANTKATLTITAVGDDFTGTKKVIDLDNSGEYQQLANIQVGEGLVLSYDKDGNDYYVAKVNPDVAGIIEVNNAWIAYDFGADVYPDEEDPKHGKFYKGFNAFASLKDLTYNHGKDGAFVEDATVVTASTIILKNGDTYAYTTPGFFFAENANGVTFQGETGVATSVTITGGPLYLMGAVVIKKEADYAAAITAAAQNAQKFTIANGLTVNVSDLRVGMPLCYDDFDPEFDPEDPTTAAGIPKRQASVADLTISGTVVLPKVDGRLVAGPLSKISVTADGKVVIPDEAVINAGASLSVTGDADVKAAAGYQYAGGSLHIIDGAAVTFTDTKASLSYGYNMNYGYSHNTDPAYSSFANKAFINVDGWGDLATYKPADNTITLTFDNTILDVVASEYGMAESFFVFNKTSVGDDMAKLPAVIMNVQNGSVFSATTADLNLEEDSNVTVNVETGSTLNVASVTNFGTINVKANNGTLYGNAALTATGDVTNSGTISLTGAEKVIPGEGDAEPTIEKYTATLTAANITNSNKIELDYGATVTATTKLEGTGEIKADHKSTINVGSGAASIGVIKLDNGSTLQGTGYKKGNIEAKNDSVVAVSIDVNTNLLIDGSTFDGSLDARYGSYKVTGNSKVHARDFQGTLVLEDATLTNSTVSGTANGRTVSIAEEKFATFKGTNNISATIANDGTINVGTTDAAAALTAGNITNNNSINVIGSLTASAITNNKSIEVTGSAETDGIFAANVTNNADATITLTGATLETTTAWGLANSGTIKLLSGSVLRPVSVDNFASGTIIVNASTIDGGDIDNAGTLVITGDSKILGTYLRKTANLESGSLTDSNTLQYDDPTCTITIAAKDSSNADNIFTFKGTNSIGSTIVNEGTMNVTGIDNAVGNLTAAAITNNSSIDATNGNITANGAIANGTSDINTASITAKKITAGSIENYGTVTANGTGSSDGISASGDIVNYKSINASKLTQTGTNSKLTNGAEVDTEVKAEIIISGALSGASVSTANYGKIEAASITNAGDITNGKKGKASASISAKDGSITAKKITNNNGTISATSDITATDEVKNYGEISAKNLTAGTTSGNPAAFTGNAVKNYGKISLSGTNAGKLKAGAITNGENSITASITGKSIDAYGKVTNYGTIGATDGRIGITTHSGNIENIGHFKTTDDKAQDGGFVYATTITADGKVTNGGLIDASGDVTIKGADGLANSNAKAKILAKNLTVGTTSGTPAAFTGNAITNSGTIEVSGTNAGILKAGAINNGTSQIKTASITAASIIATGDITNYGSITVSGTLSAASFTNNAGSTLNIVAKTNAAAMTVTGDFTNNGTLTIDANGLLNLAPGTATQIISVTGAITEGSIMIAGEGVDPDNFQVMINENAGSKGIWLFKNGGEPVSKETIVVNRDWKSLDYGTTVTFGGDEYRLGVNAYSSATEIQFGSDTDTLKFASSLESYGNLTLTSSMDVTVWTGNTQGGKLVLNTLTIGPAANATKPLVVTLDGATTVSTTTISGANNVDFDGGDAKFGDLTITNGSRVNIGELDKTNTTTVTGNVSISGGSDVDFDDVTSIAGNVSITGQSEVEFDRNTTIGGNLMLGTGSTVEADQGFAITATSAEINGELLVTNKDDENQWGNTTADLGDLTGYGKIYTGWDSQLSFNGTVYAGKLDVDVTGYGDVYNGYAGDAATVVINGSGSKDYYAARLVDGAEKLAKYFKISNGSNLAMNTNARYVSFVEPETPGDLRSVIDAQWTGDTSTKVGDTALQYYADNVVIRSGKTYSTDDSTAPTTRPAGVYFDMHEGQTIVVKNATFTSAVFGGMYYATEVEDDLTPTTISSVNLNLRIDGGTFKKAVVGGDRIDVEGYYRHNGNCSVTINGGNFYGLVAAGEMYNLTSVGSRVLVENTNLTIAGGWFQSGKFVYGGNVALKKAASAAPVVRGNTNVTIKAGDKAENSIDLNNLIVGSYGDGVVKGNTQLTLTGNLKGGSENTLSIDSIWGGCSSDVMDDVDTVTREYKGYVNGARILTFTGFNGELDCDHIGAFSKVQVNGGSDVTLSNAAGVRLDDVSNWEFEFGSTLNGDFKNDFAKNAQLNKQGKHEGDTLWLNLADAAWSDYKDGWTLFSGMSQDAIASFDGFSSVTGNTDNDLTTAELTFALNSSKDAWIATDATYKYTLSKGTDSMVLTRATLANV